jgi:hypothetical protein
MKHLELKDTISFRINYLEPALSAGLIEMTQPDSPRSPTQKYRLIAKGIEGSPLSNPPSSPLSNPSSNPQVIHLLGALKQGAASRASLMKHLGLEDPVSFRLTYLEPALSTDLVEMTQPDSPRSPTQKYRLTAKGIEALNASLPEKY